MNNEQHGLHLAFDAAPIERMAGFTILDEIEAFFRRFVVMEESAYTITALWVVHTYTYKAAIWTPYMAVTSAEKRCGKTQYLEVAEYLVRAPLTTADITAAALFRMVEKYRPTMLLDEQDAAKEGDKEKFQSLRAVLNAGAKRNGKVHRVVGKGKDMDVQAFSCFCPKAVAGIGCLEDTVADRSIPIKLKRKLRSEKIDYLDEDLVRPVAEDLGRRISRWSESHFVELKAARPQLPGELNDRQKDGASPLLAIADAAGGDWPENARKAIVHIHAWTPSDEESIRTQLLLDLKTIFVEAEAAVLATTGVIAKLAEIQTSPWADWNRGKGLTPHSLARLLKDFKVYPWQGTVAGERFRGYRAADLAEAWERYLPARSGILPLPGIKAGYCAGDSVYAGETLFSKRDSEARNPASKSAPDPHEHCVLHGIPLQSPGMRERADEQPPSHCYVHGQNAEFYELPGGGWNCARCHPPAGA